MRFVITCVALLLAVGAPVHAGERSGAFAARGGTAMAGVFGEAMPVLYRGPDVVLFNPAALIGLRSPSIELGYQDTYNLGLVHQGHAAIGWRVSPDELIYEDGRPRLRTATQSGVAFGLSLDVTTVDIGEGGAESYTEVSPTLGLAWPMAGGAAFGGALRLFGVTSSLDDVEGAGVAVDFGLTLPLADRLDIAIGLRNLLGSVSWKDGGNEALPRELAAAVGVGVHARVRMGVGVSDDGRDDGLDLVNVGADVAALPEVLFFGVGYEARQSGGDREGRLTAGARVFVDQIGVGYAFVPEGITPGITHRLTLEIGL
jgi:hypothetical protein